MRGKGSNPVLTPDHLWDHPRLCGEKDFHVTENFTHLGSPPPMRGKEYAQDVVSGKIRITPAYAGKRCSHDAGVINPQDHPRLCGEKLKATPPHRNEPRITPAYAGKRC